MKMFKVRAWDPTEGRVVVETVRSDSHRAAKKSIVANRGLVPIEIDERTVGSLRPSRKFLTQKADLYDAISRGLDRGITPANMREELLEQFSESRRFLPHVERFIDNLAGGKKPIYQAMSLQHDVFGEDETLLAEVAAKKEASRPCSRRWPRPTSGWHD